MLFFILFYEDPQNDSIFLSKHIILSGISIKQLHYFLCVPAITNDVRL